MEATKAKSFYIPKQLVMEAYKKVKENKGAAGIDAISIKDFEKNLQELHREAIEEELCKNGLSVSNVFVLLIIVWIIIILSFIFY